MLVSCYLPAHPQRVMSLSFSKKEKRGVNMGDGSGTAAVE